MESSAVRRSRTRRANGRRVYLAETPLPSSPLPGLDACARFVDRVVGTLWWHERFPDRDLGHVPRLRPAAARARRSSATRTTARPSRCRAATAPRASCSTSSRTGRSASTPGSPTTAARSRACCSTPSTSSAAPSAPRCSRRRTRSTACTSASPPTRRARRSPALRMGRAPAPRQGPAAHGVAPSPTASPRRRPARSTATSAARRCFAAPAHRRRRRRSCGVRRLRGSVVGTVEPDLADERGRQLPADDDPRRGSDDRYRRSGRTLQRRVQPSRRRRGDGRDDRRLRVREHVAADGSATTAADAVRSRVEEFFAASPTAHFDGEDVIASRRPLHRAVALHVDERRRLDEHAPRRRRACASATARSQRSSRT